MKKVAFLLVTLMFLLGCTSNQNNLLYYEIVHEKSDCKPYCSLEYIVLSNGIMLKKESMEKEFNGFKVDLVDVGEQKAIQAITFAEQSVNETKDSTCSNCNNFHLFLIKGGKPWMFLEQEEKTPEFIKTIMEDSKKLFLEGQSTEDFFVQFVFKRVGQDAVDYHFFSDGVVLREEFIGFESRLGNAGLFRLSEEKKALVKSMATSDFFGSISSLKNCQKNGLEYGYLEIKNNGLYDFVWTCGAEKSAADQLFNGLLQEFG